MQKILSVVQPSKSEQIIKKSKFISRIIPVKSEEEATQQLQKIRDIESKATHNCFAFIIGDNKNIQRASDDGEPSQTAGAPILEVLKKENITDALVVVTRYFGGIKLGAGGLIRAYGSSTSQVINEGKIVELVDQRILDITLDYQNNDTLVYDLKQLSINILNTTYTTQVTTTIAVDEDKVDEIIKNLTQKFNGNISFKEQGTKRIAVPYKKRE